MNVEHPLVAHRVGARLCRDDVVDPPTEVGVLLAAVVLQVLADACPRGELERRLDERKVEFLRGKESSVTTRGDGAL